MNNKLTDLIYGRYAANDESFRPHHGASQGGEPCLRKQWYSFRHVSKVVFDGRMLRLFARGHREEQFFVDDLRSIGLDVQNVDRAGNQFRLVCPDNKHIGGSCDGYFRAGFDIDVIPRGTIGLCEFKTFNAKSFKKLVDAQSVADVKPLHYAQMQLYMGWSKLGWCIYLAVCKDNDELYCEIVRFNQSDFMYHENNMIRVVAANEPPERITENKSDFSCRYCDRSDVCWEEQFTLNISCRTCVYAMAANDGSWRCQHEAGDPIIGDLGHETTKGCDNHLIIPALLAKVATPIGSDVETNSITYETRQGNHFANARAGGFTSWELAKIISVNPSLLDAGSLVAIKAAFDAEIKDVQGAA
ncbi:hypothetical protein [Bowmanella sp. JS7-9]|uniref:YqaJ viral recombinase domain-containing protein n=1 Tax=Pseudobowmanella zhangzhouensis TaxID=1537679 RepID=A0ABW1XLF9_9ALTE|nr:hypothetical protein [Bowmanella sp. JS7-9]